MIKCEDTFDTKGKYHSKNDEPALTGDMLSIWFKHGLRHRDNDRPAVLEYDKPLECDDRKIVSMEWFVNGKRHRTSGPAILSTLGEYYEWWVNGLYVGDVIEDWAKEMGIDLNNIMPDDEMMMLIKWSGKGEE